MHTGKVRKINAQAIQGRLEQNDVVLISPLGYSPTGEIFNLTMENVVTEVAIALSAEKLILLIPGIAQQLPRCILKPCHVNSLSRKANLYWKTKHRKPLLYSPMNPVIATLRNQGL